MTGGPVAHRFQAMASPWEVLVDGVSPVQARTIAGQIEAEVHRIESRWSRYRPDSVLSRLNAGAGGPPQEVDPETARLLDYAAVCVQMSGGQFDPTCGILRRVWRFDAGAGVPPDPVAITALLPFIGWHRLTWQRPWLTLPAGMELDFGGLGKEYAVDRGIDLASQAGLAHVLVNGGGDLAVTGPRTDGQPWQVGSWDDLALNPERGPRWELASGALTTSGTTRRYLLHQGRRYGHILDPRRGWPVEDAPLSVSVAATTCTEAGVLSTLAMLHGAEAETFLRAQGVRFRCLRDGGVATTG